ncbi:MAG: Stk1 family PASTA domain-containing Ser/Thr kinase [Actinobacteria bacterium]|nr:Stk1 family PASTA domain-containing Ser/Thr kinase [Actinomycetota bacterium]MDQ3531605.1 Stk1 family PASTA domain-containing Ser/Thr kinase [Actinomycetota bacterium]
MNTPNRTAFGGRYEVIERAGAGGMAEVYRARDELLGREVAVKVLSERFSQDRAFVERFRREAQAVANLNHPNIVSLYDFGSDDSTYYIVMEYIDGRALEDIVRDDGPLLPERAAEIAGDVARALQRAHKAGLIHRDIKPSNIMMTSSGEVKVTDFGIVRALSNDGEQTMTQAGMVIGTAAYLSPEQAQGKTLDARSDVYSLGVVLYEVLTGGAPFKGDTPLSVAYKHVREDAPPPSSVNPDVPEGLDAIVMKAMSKNPDNRYGSAAEMAEDLDRFRAGHKVHATPLLATSAATVVSAPPGGTEVLPADAPLETRAGSRRAGLYVAAALAALALIALLAYLLSSNFFDGNGSGGAPRVRVPGVVGLDIAQARANLEDFRLEAGVEKTRDEAPAGEVISQNPEGGSRVERGTTVTLTVSRGPTPSNVPEIVGLSLEDAEAALEDEGLVLGATADEPSDEFDEGIVSDQSPDPGDEVEEGSPVDVTVSSGSGLVAVPPVEGLTETEAVAEIRAAGLVPSATSVTDETEAGTVISQNPSEGDQVESGSTVTIEVSTGPEEDPSPTSTDEGAALRSLVGQDGDDVEAALEREGIQVEQVDAEKDACTGAPGTVCSQEPAPGTIVTEGDTVTIFVLSKGKPDKDDDD